MRERIIITFLVALGGLCVAAVAHESHNPYVAFWSTFGIIEFTLLCTYNYLENGIWWLWGKENKNKVKK